jgi:nucleotide-binding universal stress UspA family protein
MNPIRSILVHVDAGAHCAARLQLARTLAAQHGSSVTALYAVRPVYVPLAFEVASAGVASDALLAIDEDRLAAARKMVADVCATPGPKAEWQAVADGSEYEFIHQSFYADLLVLGQHDPEQRDAGVLPDFVPSVLMGSGKPALVVPHIQSGSSRFENVLIAWKESRESARAVSAALPILQAAGAVHVAIEDATQEGPAGPLHGFFERHGVLNVQYESLGASSLAAGDALLSRAADLSADLMVMGCYSHSRAREVVLGGATRTVLKTMTLPVLMAH